MIEVIVNGVQSASRLSRHQANLAIASIMGMRGTCRRAQVGAVITKNNRIVSTGYNGSLADDHCLNCNIADKCYNAIHAEANAIASAAKLGISLDGGILYCTHAPCVECAKLIIQSGIHAVYYLQNYRLDDGLKLLISSNTEIYHHQY